MNVGHAVASLAALSHEHRLGAYRMLVEAGPEGLHAGAIAARLHVPPSSLTFHMQHLHRAGLVTQERRSRQIIYAADFAVMNELVGYLTENCCGQSQGACAAAPCETAPRGARKPRNPRAARGLA